MKKIIFLAALLFNAFSYGQLKKVELTPDEIDFIANNKANILGESLDNKDFDRIMSLNNRYNGQKCCFFWVYSF